MSEAPELNIWIVARDLTDDSQVFDVEIGNLKVECVTENDAEALAEGIVDLLNKHTNTSAGVVFG